MSARRCVFISLRPRPGVYAGFGPAPLHTKPKHKSPALCTWAQGNQQLPMCSFICVAHAFWSPNMRFRVMTVVDERRRRSISTDLAQQRQLFHQRSCSCSHRKLRQQELLWGCRCLTLPVPQGDCDCSRGRVLGLPPPPHPPEYAMFVLGVVPFPSVSVEENAEGFSMGHGNK